MSMCALTDRQMRDVAAWHGRMGGKPPDLGIYPRAHYRPRSTIPANTTKCLWCETPVRKFYSGRRRLFCGKECGCLFRREQTHKRAFSAPGKQPLPERYCLRCGQRIEARQNLRRRSGPMRWRVPLKFCSKSCGALFQIENGLAHGKPDLGIYPRAWRAWPRPTIENWSQCWICGNWMRIDSRAKFLCSSECRMIYARIVKWRTATSDEELTCSWCGNKYKSTWTNSGFDCCSRECRREKRNQNLRLLRRRTRRGIRQSMHGQAIRKLLGKSSRGKWLPNDLVETVLLLSATENLCSAMSRGERHA